MSKSVTYFAEIAPKQEHFSSALEAVDGILEMTRAEPGCLRFDLFTNPDRTHLYLYEEWRDDTAFNHHHAQDYTRAVYKAYEGWLEKLPELKRLETVR